MQLMDTRGMPDDFLRRNGNFFLICLKKLKIFVQDMDLDIATEVIHDDEVCYLKEVSAK